MALTSTAMLLAGMLEQIPMVTLMLMMALGNAMSIPIMAMPIATIME